MKTLEYTSNPIAPAMSADEFNAFLAQERLERTLANIARRAETLWVDGYTAKAEAGFHFVYGPKDQAYIVFTGNPKTGEYWGRLTKRNKLHVKEWSWVAVA